MLVRALDTNGDWQFGKGRNSYLRDLDALKQNLVTRIKSWKGNCFFAVQDGIDWNNWFDINRKIYLNLDCKRCILQTDGVIRIDSYESTINDRQFGLTCEIATIYGNTSIVL